MNKTKKRFNVYSPSTNPYIVLIKGECETEIVNAKEGRKILHKMLDKAYDEYIKNCEQVLSNTKFKNV